MIRILVNQIHLHPYQLFVYLAGGASQALGWLISVPGASNNVLEAVVPYSRMSMIQLPGKIPTQFCSQQTAGEMALLAYNRALKLARTDSPVVGGGFTGSLTGMHPNHGEHRFHVATLSLCQRVCKKGKMRISTAFCADLTEFDMSNESEETFTEDEELEQLLNGDVCFKAYRFGSSTFLVGLNMFMRLRERKVHYMVLPLRIHIPQMQIKRLYILSGSFNPLHEGHLKLLEVTTSICGNGSPCFELSEISADTPPLSVEEIKNRLQQFDSLVIEDFDILDVLKDMFITIPADTFNMDISSTEIIKSRCPVASTKAPSMNRVCIYHLRQHTGRLDVRF